MSTREAGHKTSLLETTKSDNRLSLMIRYTHQLRCPLRPNDAEPGPLATRLEVQPDASTSDLRLYVKGTFSQPGPFTFSTN